MPLITFYLAYDRYGRRVLSIKTFPSEHKINNKNSQFI